MKKVNKTYLALGIAVCVLLLVDIGVHWARSRSLPARAAAPPKAPVSSGTSKQADSRVITELDDADTEGDPGNSSDSPQNVVQIRNLQIVDSSGKERIDLGSSGGLPSIILAGRDGEPRMGLTVMSDGSHLIMFDPKIHRNLTLDGGAQPGVHIYKGEQEWAALALDSDGWPTAQLEDSEGNDRIYLAYDPSKDRSVLHLNDAGGNQSAEMALTRDYAVIDATDKSSTRRAVLKCSSSGVSQVYLADPSGDSSWSQADPGNSIDQ